MHVADSRESTHNSNDIVKEMTEVSAEDKQFLTIMQNGAWRVNGHCKLPLSHRDQNNKKLMDGYISNIMVQLLQKHH